MYGLLFLQHVENLLASDEADEDTDIHVLGHSSQNPFKAAC